MLQSINITYLLCIKTQAQKCKGLALPVFCVGRTETCKGKRFSWRIVDFTCRVFTTTKNAWVDFKKMGSRSKSSVPIFQHCETELCLCNMTILSPLGIFRWSHKPFWAEDIWDILNPIHYVDFSPFFCQSQTFKILTWLRSQNGDIFLSCFLTT